MKGITAAQAAMAVGGKVIYGDPGRRIGHICLDSRKRQPFVRLVGILSANPFHLTDETAEPPAYLFKGLFLNSYNVHTSFSFGWLNIPFCISSR